MKLTSILALIAMLALFILTGAACANPDNLNNPNFPGIGNENGSDPIDPGTPTPFAGAATFEQILDFAFESDGDLAISDTNAGIVLFDTFGVSKRVISNGATPFQGLVDIGPGVIDSGRGVIATGDPIGCAWASYYDDAHVTGGTFFGAPAAWWWGGTPHPPQPCSTITASGAFDCDTNVPRGIDIHPITGWLFLKSVNTKITVDGDCDFEFDEIPPFQDLNPGIIAMHPNAPGQGSDPNFYEGTADFVVYHNLGDVQTVNAYGYPMADAAVQVFNWDPTNPFTMLPPRNGINTQNVADIEFDAYGRLICSIPNSNAWAITEPVVPADMIVVQRIIGGAQNGESHNPGDFYGPTGVAVDPRTQEIYISDTGLNRVQVFDNQGKFIRMFGAGIGTQGLGFTAPRAIEVDSFGNVFVSTQEGLQIYNQFGEPVTYGAIEGYVKDKSTGVTLDNAVVSISSTYREFATATNSQGFFKLSAVPQGSHTVIANRAGYQANSVNIFVNGGQKTTVTLYLERTGVGKTGFGKVTGTLISSLDGDPITGFHVTILGYGASSSNTNGNGEFALNGVPEGHQVLQVYASSQLVYEQDITVVSDAVLPLGVIYLPI